MIDKILKEMQRRGAYHAVTHIKFANHEVPINTIYFNNYQDFIEWCDLQNEIYKDFDRVIAINTVHRI